MGARNTILLLLPGILWVALFSGCKPEKPSFSEIPAIELVDFGPSTVQQYVDSIYFELAYEDGDGDLGENEPGVTNLFVRDNRINIEYALRIKELVPNGASVPIKGNLNFTLDNTILTGNGTSESVDFTVWVVDRAGNKSNEIQTPSITVTQ